ncbi:MAG: DUF11 domain-containing protein [Phycisphaerales bacterium]|nr:DUF11 domain-containing protein [Phycisphaerales bacterium]
MKRNWGAARPAIVVALLAMTVSAVSAQTGSEMRRWRKVFGENARGGVVALERVSPREVRVNTEFTYTLRVENLTDTAIANVIVNESFDDGFALSSTAPAGSSSGAGVTWRIESLPPRGVMEYAIRGRAVRTGDTSQCATATFETKACSSIGVVEPALALEKWAPEVVMLCDTIPVKIRVTNTGTGVAENVVVNDRLPAGWSTTDGRSDVSFNVGSLASGASREVSFVAKAGSTGSFTNQAMATASGDLSAQASASTRVVQPVLTLSKSCPEVRYVGRNATFSLTVSNTGDAPADSAMLVDTLPPGVAFLNASDGGTFSNGRVSWSLGTLAPGATRTVSIEAKAMAIGVHQNSAAVNARCASAEDACPFEVRGIPALLLEVVDLADPIEVNAIETYEITVVNQGSAVGTNIVIRCVLPSQQKYESATGPAPATATGQTVTFAPLPALPPGASVKYRVVSRGEAVGDVRFKVEMTGDQLDSPVEETESTHIY